MFPFIPSVAARDAERTRKTQLINTWLGAEATTGILAFSTTEWFTWHLAQWLLMGQIRKIAQELSGLTARAFN